jgi:hypothetical protein
MSGHQVRDERASIVPWCVFPGPRRSMETDRGPWTPPRTPWGDPDLQGNLTNLYEVGTPFERPDTFAGRRLEDVKGEELARIRRDIQERTRTEQLAGEIGRRGYDPGRSRCR